MKIHILDIQDGNGCQLLTYFDQDRAIEKARDWMRTLHRFGDVATEDNINANLDEMLDGHVLNFSGGARLHLGESDIDLSGLAEVLSDARHTLAQNQRMLSTLYEKFGSNLNIMDGYEKANSRYHATEQAIHLTLQKLKGQS